MDSNISRLGEQKEQITLTIHSVHPLEINQTVKGRTVFIELDLLLPDESAHDGNRL